MSEPYDPNELDWDLEERDRLLNSGILTDENVPDPTEVIISEDD